MPVPSRLREIEAEIDSAIAALPIWQTPRTVLLETALEVYRDEVEVLLIQMAAGDAKELGAFEDRRRAGTFQTIKWAMEFSHERGTRPVDPLELQRLIEPAQCYEAFVDTLKLAAYDLIDVQIDDANKTIVAFEGGNLTGQDANLVMHAHRTLPFRTHIVLVPDSEQLTRRWTAGEFRQCFRRLAEIAESAESETICLEDGTPLTSRPIILDVGAFAEEPMKSVIEDLTLTPEKISQDKWRLTTFLELPIIRAGDRSLAASNMLKYLALSGDDYMLRIAARVDEKQYSTVSGLREERMIDHCKGALTEHGWSANPHFKLKDPPNEIDIYARRDTLVMIIGLRSTLRPESPWEVKKRNDCILEAIDRTAKMLTRSSIETMGVVLTDGYRGDYVTWRRALEKGIGIGTIEDITDIARDPTGAFQLLKLRVGFSDGAAAARIPDVECELTGWKLRIVDAALGQTSSGR